MTINSQPGDQPRSASQRSFFWKTLMGCCLVLIFGVSLAVLLFSPVQLSAHMTDTPPAMPELESTATVFPGTATSSNTAPPMTSVAPKLQIKVGFTSTYNTLYKSGNWTPINVTLTNGNNEFRGTLIVNTIMIPAQPTISKPSNQASGLPSPWSFEEPVTLTKSMKKQVTIYAPLFPGHSPLQGIAVKLRDARGKVVASQTALGDNIVYPGFLFAATLSDPGSNFDMIRNGFIRILVGPLILSALNKDTMPSTDIILENFDVLILDNFTSSKLSKDQILAIQTWVNRGGVLIEVGGPEWKRTLGSLPADMVPVDISGTTTLPPGSTLLAPNDPLQQDSEQYGLKLPLPNNVVASTAKLRSHSAFTNNQVVLSIGSTPIFVQARQGQGVICYLAIDPAGLDLAEWRGTHALWRMVLVHALGERLLIYSPGRIYNTGPGQILARPEILEMVEPNTLPGPVILISLFCSYILVLGPLRLMLIRQKRIAQSWSWPIVLGGILIFTLLSYPLASFLKSGSVMNTSLSIVQLNQNGTSAHATTYSGIYVPEAGNYRLNYPGEGMVQPVSNQFMTKDRSALYEKDVQATILKEKGKMDMTLHNLAPWTLQHVVAEQDIQLQGGLFSQLALQNNRVVGTIQNTLRSSLSDVYILIDRSYVRIGSLGANETREINLPLVTLPQAGPKEVSLATQIIKDAGLSENYAPYAQGQTPQNELQRHMALLSILNRSDETFTSPACKGSCKTQAIADKNSIFITGGQVPNPNMSTDEPLLLPNAQATLIGWANQSLTPVMTINGRAPIGSQESFIRMPLNIDISGSAVTPPGMIKGRVTNIQSDDAQQQLKGIYAMSFGNITFEFLPPATSLKKAKTVTFTVPDLWANPFGPGSGQLPSHLQAQLYNWQTATWDIIPLQRDTFTMSNFASYVGPGERLLLQVKNGDLLQGGIFFGTPSISLT